ncbi:MAG: SPFH domain-containing protein [Clostridia bacterium]|nr:SPFH domain-containing protein [Clostridia bacterium]
MGIIKAIFQSMGGGFADSWQEVLEADRMSEGVVFTKGVKVRPSDKRNNNKKGTEDTISNGSIIHVYDNQCMLLVDGGKVVDFTAEPGYYKVDNSAMPSLFAGQFGASLKESFSRVKYGGVPSTSQKAFFINLQEIKGIKFGTRTPVNYFDNFYNAELFLRAFGTYSIKITDPLKFYAEAIPRDAERVEITDINEQYLSEFLEAFQAAINKMSADGIRLSHVPSKSRELSQYMATELDDNFKSLRGFEILSVGIASVSYDEESKKLINMRNQGAMLGDPTVREGYVQGAMARGFEAAGSNQSGGANTFVGLGMGMNAMGGFGAFSETNRTQMQQQQQREATPSAGGWTCPECGNQSTGKFCNECGQKKPEAAGGWTCPNCGMKNTGKFCNECGQKKPDGDWFCPECGTKNTGKFCNECGRKKD